MTVRYLSRDPRGRKPRTKLLAADEDVSLGFGPLGPVVLDLGSVLRFSLE